LWNYLNDLLNTTKYDAPWPEDSYTGEEKKAYDYIVTQIPGNTPPKNGTVRPTDISTISYPNDGTFSQAAFTDVQNHLIKECSDFVTATAWFGTGGIFYTINLAVAVVSSNDLTNIAQLMEVPPSTLMSVILNAIFTDIISIIRLIPEIGAAISTVISIAWSSAQIIIGAQKAGQPIQESVAAMADVLNQYLANVVNATGAQFNTLSGNYGKLTTFSNLVVEGKISEKAFFPSGGQPAASNGDDPQKPPPPPPLPEGYIMAAAKAWKVIIYKGLFVTQPQQFYAQANLVTSIPTNVWNPAGGAYDYISYYDTQFKDPKGNVVSGYMSIEWGCGVPKQVKQALFGPASDLNLNPIEVYLSTNGWPQIVPEVEEGIPYDWPAN
jgi:hypothetical protein